MNQDSDVVWVKADTDVADRILRRISNVVAHEQPDFVTQMLIISDLLVMSWARLCPGCRENAMRLFESRLPVFAAEAAKLAAEQDAPSVCH